MTTYESHESYDYISNYIENLESIIIDNPQLYNMTPKEFLDSCLYSLDYKDSSIDKNISTLYPFDIYIDIISDRKISYQEYDSYYGLLCVGASDELNSEENIIDFTDYNNSILPILFPNSMNILCDGGYTCGHNDFLLTDSIDIYCRGIYSCQSSNISNANNVYCGAAQACRQATFYNVVCLLLQRSSFFFE